MTPEDDVIHTEEQLTEALKGNSQTAMDKSGIKQIKKLDVIFNPTARKFHQRKEKKHPLPEQKTPAPATRMREEMASYSRVSKEAAHAPKLKTNSTISKKGSQQQQMPNFTTQDEDNTPENNACSNGCTIKTLTQEVMLAWMDTIEALATPRKLSSRILY